jgi:hypothetical protein
VVRRLFERREKTSSCTFTLTGNATVAAHVR